MTLLAGLAGAAVVAGALLVVAWWIGSGSQEPPRGAGARAPRSGPAASLWSWSRARKLEVAAAAAVTVVVFLVLGVPVAALLAGALVATLPPLLRDLRGTTTDIDRLDALALWVRRVATLMRTNTDLTKALLASTDQPPKALAEPLANLASRMRAGWEPEASLRALSDDLDCAPGDLLASALILGLRNRGGGLTSVLDGLSRTIADDVGARRQVEADRAKPRREARVVTLMSVAGMVGLWLFNPGAVEVYRTPTGQVVLLVIAAGFAGCFVAMRRITTPPVEPRFLNSSKR